MPLLSNNLGQNQPAFGQQRPSGAEEELYINSTPSPGTLGKPLAQEWEVPSSLNTDLCPQEHQTPPITASGMAISKV